MAAAADRARIINNPRPQRIGYRDRVSVWLVAKWTVFAPAVPGRPERLRVLYLAKLVAAVCMLVGLAPRVAALGLGLWVQFELRTTASSTPPTLDCARCSWRPARPRGDALAYRTVLDAWATSRGLRDGSGWAKLVPRSWIVKEVCR